MTWDAWCQLCWDEYEAGFAIREVTLSGGDAHALLSSIPPHVPPGVNGAAPVGILNPATGSVIPLHLGDTTELVLDGFLLEERP